ATNLSQSSSSWYSKLNSTDEGLDPYTRAVSDVYQDALGEGSYIGKGIIDIDAYELALSDRIPENRILSHDLLEGCHARSGLISDVQLYEDYPASYLSDMKRRHRWIRGDWQIASWLFPNVPGPNKTKKKNPLSTLSRWKIADNLRRSLYPIALFTLLLFGWIVSSSPWFWTFIVLIIIVPAPLMAFIYNFFNKSEELNYTQHAVQIVESFVTSLVQQVWSIITLPYEAFMNADAIARTLWRVWFSHRNLLQWDPFNMVSAYKKIIAHYKEMWISPAIALILFIVLSKISIGSLLMASPMLILWILAPLLAWIVSVPPVKKPTALNFQQLSFLRKISRKTWAYFEQFIGSEDNYLPPDNFQEYPSTRIAHRTSPTNIGVSLLSMLAAHDFGYISLSKLLESCKKTLDSISLLDRYKGHLYNWYDTQSLAPLYPRYVSTVDSGNLAACLLTLKEGLLTLKTQPVISSKSLDGMKDVLYIMTGNKHAPGIFKKQLPELHRLLHLGSPSPLHLKNTLERIIQITTEIKSHPASHANEHFIFWMDKLINQVKQFLKDILELLPDHTSDHALATHNEHTKVFSVFPSLQEIAYANDNGIEKEISDGEKINISQFKASENLSRIDDLVKQCIDLSTYEYDFLYDKSQHYLSIGYNVEDHRRDAGYYDLLGSEARLGIFVAISQGKIPQESWFALGRQVTHVAKEPVLISWSGSMFEYLMPMLLMPSYENTLLDQTQRGAVHRQIEYGKKHELPWGISESCFNMFHANLDYQYRAFGVPGLGIKRGLANDYVVAPYATLMSLMVSPEEAIDNLHALSAAGGQGPWGFYEAIDYTPARLQRGQTAVVVKAFMTHHQGMSLLGMSYLLNGPLMQQRFESDLHFQTSLLLLQEKIPLVTSFSTPAVDLGEVATEANNSELQIIRTPFTPIPEVQLLSNGRYHVMVSNSGGGYSRWKDLAVTRWREDGTCEGWGNFCYIRDLETNVMWSNAYQPTLTEAEHYEVIFSEGRAEFRRRDQQIESHTEIVVSPEDDVELRRLRINNRSRRKRIIEITSYAEVVLNIPIAEVLHPAFSNLFVETSIHAEQQAILCTRRPRSEEEHDPWMFHLMKVHGGDTKETTFETSR
ncbi:MAG TPA: glucoamylase family protein, partial [Saprospiraceae bacterium]|nr:glucoamylase family protein [Saprospiraceae bacterium]